MDKIYENLGIEKLDEEKQKEIKQYLDEAVELKAKEMADTKLEEEKDKLVEHYENKFEEYKEDITSKFSNFVDNILEEELQIPEKIKEYAKLGERYQPIYDKLKTMMGIDEGTFDDEAKSLLKESKDEITKLKGKINSLTSDKMTLEADAKEMAAHIYLRQKCDGLTESKKERIHKLLEGVSDKDEIDRKFKILTESYTDDSVNEKKMYCSKCDVDVEVDEDDKDATCPECSGELVEKKEDKGKGKDDVDDKDKKNVDENTIMNQWIKMLRENTY